MESREMESTESFYMSSPEAVRNRSPPPPPKSPTSGTSDRIIMVSGAVDDILKAMELILAKLLNELDIKDNDDDEPRTKVRLIVSNSSCGSIIGKGGATIKSFIDGSEAGIKISPQDNYFYGLNDRLVTVTGILVEQLRAIGLILSKLYDLARTCILISHPTLII